MATAERHKWAFKARFRRCAFGWRSQPAIQRVKEAVSEIKKVRRGDPALAAEGALTFLERLSPALEQVDSSSGAIGTAVNRAIEQLVPIIAKAPVGDERRRVWLERPAEVGLLALHWFVEGYGYEITSADVWAAYDATVAAAKEPGEDDGIESRIRDLVASSPGGFVAQILGRRLDLP